MSCVICQVSCGICLVSHVRCHILLLLILLLYFFLLQSGLLSIGPTPSSLKVYLFLTPWWHVYLFWGKGLFSVISAQTGSNWFLLSCCYAFQDWWVENLYGLGFENGCLAEGHTEAAMCVKGWLHKFNLKILKTVTCLGFFQHWRINQRWNFGCTVLYLTAHY